MSDFLIDPFLCPADPWPAREGLGVVRRVYLEKYRIAALVRPRRILEIGVRFGYSAAAFLSACLRATYLGLDSDENPSANGGEPGAPLWARDSLPAWFPGRAEVRIADTQTLPGLPAGPWDLIHVDGCHSEAGCLRDLELAALAQPRWLLVDDSLHMPRTVGRAIHLFLQRHDYLHVSLPTVRGDVLIQVRGGAPVVQSDA